MPRNSSGTYSLPAGNPVAPNTLIETAWANPTMSDLGAAVTDSLDRNGRGSMLAPLRLTDGTPAAPGFAFTSETTTGMYRAAANTLAFAVAGVLAMSMNATTIAFAKTVSFTNAVAFPQGTAGAPGIAFSLDLDTGMWSPGADTIAWSTGGVERVRLNASGYVGIGTTSPQRTLHIAAAEPALVLQETDQAADQQRWRMHSTAATFTLDAVNDAFSASQAAYQVVRGAGATVDRHVFLTGGTERARIDASGNVGVGGSPAYRLHAIAASADAIVMAQSSDASGVLAFLQANGSTDARVGTLSNVPLLFMQNSAERARFATGGTFTLLGGQQITGATVASSGVGMELLWDGTQSIVQSYSRSAAAYQVMTFDGSQLRFNSGGAERMRITATGQVGIGLTPTYKLDVNGSVSASNYVIGQELAAGAGTFGFTNANGPGIQAWGSATANAGALLFVSTGVERMRLLSAAAGRNEFIIGGAVADNGLANRTALQLTGGSNGAILTFRTSAGHQGYLYASPGGDVSLIQLLNANLDFGTSGATRLRITGAGVIQDGNGLELGYRRLNRVTYGSGASTLQQSDDGKCHYKTDATNVTVPSGLADGTYITIYNASGSARTIVQGAGLTLQRAGIAQAGNFTLAAFGLARVWIIGGTTAVIDGNIS